MSGQNKQLAEERSVLLSELSQGEIDSIDASLPLSSQGLDSMTMEIGRASCRERV